MSNIHARKTILQLGTRSVLLAFIAIITGLYAAPAWAMCGSIVGEIEAGEACDDNNTVSGDGCNDQCEIELGWACSRACAGFENTDAVIVGSPCEFDTTGDGLADSTSVLRSDHCTTDLVAMPLPTDSCTGVAKGWFSKEWNTHPSHDDTFASAVYLSPEFVFDEYGTIRVSNELLSTVVLETQQSNAAMDPILSEYALTSSAQTPNIGLVND